ncbi:TolC family protein [Paludibacter sp.]
MQQCVDTALVNNRTVKQQELNRKSKEIAYEQARMDLLPNLNASMGQSFTLGRSLTADNTYQSVNSSQSSFNLSSNITLFDGLKMKYNIDAKKAEMKASEYDVDKIKSDIELNVTVAFLQVLLYKENLKTLENQITLTRQKIEQKSLLVDAGKLAEGELFELKAQLAKEEYSITQAENNLKLAKLDLAQIIELRDFDNFDIQALEDEIEKEAILLSVDEVFNSAITHRPEIKGAESRLLSYQKNTEIARSAYFPTLSFGAQMGSGYYNLKGVPNDSFNKQFNDHLSSSVGFNLHIPIFNKFEIKNRVQTSKFAIENGMLEIENVKYELRKKIQQAYQNALAAKARYNAAQKSEFATSEAYRYAEQKYEAGRASVYELYQAKSILTQALSELSQSKFEFILRIKVLELLK